MPIGHYRISKKISYTYGIFFILFSLLAWRYVCQKNISL
nr:MAG TPA: hypothetical protein [Caudoviricetes sp.]